MKPINHALKGYHYRVTCDFDLTDKGGNKGKRTNHTYALKIEYLYSQIRRWNTIGGKYYKYYFTDEDRQRNNKQIEMINVPLFQGLWTGHYEHNHVSNLGKENHEYHTL